MKRLTRGLVAFVVFAALMLLSWGCRPPQRKSGSQPPNHGNAINAPQHPHNTQSRSGATLKGSRR